MMDNLLAAQIRIFKIKLYELMLRTEPTQLDDNELDIFCSLARDRHIQEVLDRKV